MHITHSLINSGSITEDERTSHEAKHRYRLGRFRCRCREDETRSSSIERFTRQRALSHFEAAKSTPAFRSILLPLLETYRLSEAEVREEFLRYNLGINRESNATYKLLGTQFALLINYLPKGTWFARRLEAYRAFASRFETITDIGFGLPFAWLLAAMGRGRMKADFRFVDSSQTAIDFGLQLIAIAQRQFPAETSQLSFSMKRGSIEESQEWRLPQPSAVVALDSIEHAVEPQRALKSLAEAFRGATFLIGLPVGTPIPQHQIDFEREQNALNFVRDAQLVISQYSLVPASWAGDVVGNPGFKGSIFIEAM
jgi:hypothetical protein